jgi:hypothetical protein
MRIGKLREIIPHMKITIKNECFLPLVPPTTVVRAWLGLIRRSSWDQWWGL